MNGEQSGLRVRQTEPEDTLALDLVVQRVRNGTVGQPLRAEFRFDPATPMIVTATFTPGRGKGVTWRIGRELLYQGLYDESGEGDVQVWPAPGQEGEAAWMLLESKRSSVVLELPVAEMEGWLEATYARVPVEEEGQDLDWDGFLTALLDG